MAKYQWRESKHQTEERLRAAGETWDADALDGLRLELPFPILEILEGEGTETTVHKVTPEHIRKGMQLALTPGIMPTASNTMQSTLRGLFDNDAGMIDADAADNILQLGLFGKLIYG